MKNTRDITIDEAEKKYGITTEFTLMLTNGEARFRLNCDDGTAYIRTETKDRAEGWQKAHYHRGLSETYIVQKGSILFVEFKEHEIFSRIYKAGEIFTIPKQVPHNVYMMEDSIIHTIKHGESMFHPEKLEDKADWWDDAEFCEKLNSLKGCSIEEIKIKTQKIEEQPEQPGKGNIIVLEKKEPPYSTAYIHFDNLIWQFPAWIFALLTIGIAIIGLLGQHLSTNMNISIIENVSIKLSHIVGSVFICSGILGMILAYAMHRFRYHQIKIKDGRKRKILSPQIYIQVFSNILVAILFLIGFGLFCGELKITTCLYVIILFVVISLALELYLRRHADNVERSEQNKEYEIS